MPIVNVQILKGRPRSVRTALIAHMTNCIVEILGVSAGQVRVIITEIDPENWGVGGIAKADQPQP